MPSHASEWRSKAGKDTPLCLPASVEVEINSHSGTRHNFVVHDRLVGGSGQLCT